MSRYLILLLIILNNPAFICAQFKEIRFEHLTQEDGLSGNSVRCIMQDSKGFMWIGTSNGLNKFDGNRFIKYQYDPDDPYSISNNWIIALYEDKSGNIWIGTAGGGLNKFDPKIERFSRFLHKEDNPNSISSNHVGQNAIFKDHHGHLWIGTNNGLTQMISLKTGQNEVKYEFINYKHDSNGSDNIHRNGIWTLYEDKKNDIWIGARDGSISKVDQNNKKLINIISSDDINNFLNIENDKFDPGPVRFIFHDPSDPDNIMIIGSSKNIYKYDLKENRFVEYDKVLRYICIKYSIENIWSYYLSQDSLLWVGTQKCLLLMNRQNQSTHFYQNDLNNPYSINSNVIRSIYEDGQGTLWFGTYEGVCKYDQRKQNFIYYGIILDNIKCTINSIFEDLSGNGKILWFGTRSQGLLKYDKLTKEITQFQRNIKDPITAIHQDANNLNILWISTSESGIYKFDIQKEKFIGQYFPSDGIYPKVDVHNFAASNLVRSMIAADEGCMWIATQYGLYHFNPITEVFTPYLNEPGNANSLSENKLFMIYRSLYNGRSILWIGSNGNGLSKFDPQSNSFTHYYHNPNDSTSLDDNHINSIYEDKSGTLWIGTLRGLNKFNRETRTFTHIMDNNKKLSTEIKNIFDDDNGYLWINTNSGLYKFNPETESIRVFDTKGGPPINNLSRFSYHKNKDGQRYFGGPGGLIEFNPDNFVENSHIPPIVFTDFQIFNKHVKPGKDSPLSKSIVYSDTVTLSYTQSLFSLEFAALDFTNPGKNLYAYKMEGVDPDWVHTNASRRFASYSRLDPGEYTFRVKSSNNDGKWNEESKSLTIIITPPWWRTMWAYAGYFLTLCVLFYFLRVYDLKRQRLKQELDIRHERAKKLQEIDHMKSRFFANISHEFRTPLTLILGPLEQFLSGKFKGDPQPQYSIMQRNARRLLRLINQLLDLSKVESGKMNLQLKEENIVELVKGYVNAFESLAKRKNITLTFNSEHEYIPLLVDRDKIEKILYNILSNAFKFTKEEGNIKITINAGNGREESGFVEISISDTGIGIHPDHLDKIFNRFYQIDETHKYDHTGSGIGMALARELVELHHGKIEINSVLNKGTTFTINLPLAKAHFNENNVSDISFDDQPPKDTSESASSTVGYDMQESVNLDSNLFPNVEEIPIVLVVEDNSDMQAYIRTNLNDEHRVEIANDGKEGFEKAIKIIPDIIISDVMMPRMDGIELCSKLKKDMRTSHIPVILLTAKAEIQDRIEGLETGADDYLTKPFDQTELNIRIKNLLDQRKRIYDYFGRKIGIDLGEYKIASADEEFIHRIIALIEKQLSDPDLHNQNIAQEIGLSPRQLRRKLQALIGLSPVDFIRTIRLKKARQLLIDKFGNIAQVAYEVGFNNPSYFSECFRKQFGISPSDFLRSNS